MAKIRILPAGSGGRKTTKYQVTYRDAENKRRFKDFISEPEAKRFQAQVTIDVLDGNHVSRNQTMTVSDAGKRWIDDITAAKELEASSVQDYDRTLRLHISPLIGKVKLTDLDETEIRAFIRALRSPAKGYPEGRSASMAKRTLVTLGVLLSFAIKRIRPRPLRHNVVHEMADEIAKAFDKETRKSRPKVGEDIPTINEIRALEKVLTGRLRPLVLLALYTGMRASELRGLRWLDVKLDQGELFVRQKVDRFNNIGNPKSDASHDHRVPLPANALKALKAWQADCPDSDNDLVFPTSKGTPQRLGNILKRELHKAWVEAGVTEPRDKTKPKYTGLHCLRHFYASWLINSKERGGRGLPAKEVQILIGHSTLKMTTDTYSHVFSSNNDRADLDADADALLP